MIGEVDVLPLGGVSQLTGEGAGIVTDTIVVPNPPMEGRTPCRGVAPVCCAVLS